MDAQQIKQNAKDVARAIRARDLSAECDALRQLPGDIVEDLRAAGIFRMNMPSHWGGPEMTSMDQVEVIETLCRADGSVGWCSFIWCDSGIYSGYLEEDVAKELYPELDLAQSGWVYPAVAAEEVEGGYLVDGRWIFGSGCNHCDRLAAGVIVTKNGEPVLGKSGMPSWRILLGKPEQFEICDTWYTMGLRGTGSHDYVAKGLFIPHEHSFRFGDPAPRQGAIWARPDHLLRKMSGVPLGIARDALDRAIEILETKTDRRSGERYADNVIVQETIADAEARLGAARCYVFDSLERQWEKIEKNLPLTESERAAPVMSRQLAFQTGRQVVQLLFDLVGADAVYSRNPFERQLRDMNTACQHIVAQRKTLQGPGGLLLGSDKIAAEIML
ncbi:MAG: acyl-CoA dehydrogenase family protein [Pseudomonadota bacterium]